MVFILSLPQCVNTGSDDQIISFSNPWQPRNLLFNHKGSLPFSVIRLISRYAAHGMPPSMNTCDAHCLTLWGQATQDVSLHWTIIDLNNVLLPSATKPTSIPVMIYDQYGPPEWYFISDVSTMMWWNAEFTDISIHCHCIQIFSFMTLDQVMAWLFGVMRQQAITLSNVDQHLWHHGVLLGKYVHDWSRSSMPNKLNGMKFSPN